MQTALLPPIEMKAVSFQQILLTTSFRIKDVLQPPLFPITLSSEQAIQLSSLKLLTIILSYDRTTGEYTIAIDDERVIKTAKSEDFDLGYAITIHKSQGSEYPHVCIVLPEFSSFISRKMLYTAVTRAKQKVTLITTPEVLKKVIENNADINRRTILQELIKKNIK